jgi:hypothetical protein
MQENEQNPESLSGRYQLGADEPAKMWSDGRNYGADTFRCIRIVKALDLHTEVVIVELQKLAKFQRNLVIICGASPRRLDIAIVQAQEMIEFASILVGNTGQTLKKRKTSGARLLLASLHEMNCVPGI